MNILHETPNYSFLYDSYYGAGRFIRKSDGAMTLLETGSDCNALKADLHRLKQKTGSRRYPKNAPNFNTLMDAIAGEYSFNNETGFKIMDNFTKAYIEAMLWTECDPGTDANTHDPENDFPLHGNCGIEDLAPKTLETIQKECADFQTKNADILKQAYRPDYDEARAGHDFWLTRNGHGAGFWDRGLGDIGDKLTDVSKNSPVYVYLGSDRLIYIN